VKRKRVCWRQAGHKENVSQTCELSASDGRERALFQVARTSVGSRVDKAIEMASEGSTRAHEAVPRTSAFMSVGEANEMASESRGFTNARVPLTPAFVSIGQAADAAAERSALARADVPLEPLLAGVSQTVEMASQGGLFAHRAPLVQIGSVDVQVGQAHRLTATGSHAAQVGSIGATVRKEIAQAGHAPLKNGGRDRPRAPAPTESVQR